MNIDILSAGECPGEGSEVTRPLLGRSVKIPENRWGVSSSAASPDFID